MVRVDGSDAHTKNRRARGCPVAAVRPRQSEMSAGRGVPARPRPV
ncbi:hypothetical protein EPIB1_1089 [Tritonibacter mobilis]|nr:hypothetical protein EPIB1_1089 [Tritonibacter mobilis]